MAEEKKYEITISDLSAYIGAAAFEILPENVTEQEADKYAMVAAGIIVILSILVDTFISKISLPMQPVPEIRSISGA